MSTSVHPDRERDGASPSDDRPEVAVCETCPGTVVFVESGNGDGWIATDDPVEVTR